MVKIPYACTECHMVIPDDKKEWKGDYSHKKKKELLIELENRNLSKDGKNDDLIKRLVKNDYEQKDIEQLVDELTSLDPKAETEGGKEHIISMILKEITKKYEPKCRWCPTAPVSTDHQGYVIIINPNRSDIAKKLEVDRPGKYALKVSNR